MAWLQNLAGKAEDLLVRIDKNAATVLNDSNTNTSDKSEKSNLMFTIIEPSRDDFLQDLDLSIVETESTLKDASGYREPSVFSDNVSVISEKSGLSDFEDGILTLPSKQDSLSSSLSDKQDVKTESGGFHSKSSSLQNSFISFEELPYKMEEKVMKLEQENENLNHQLINMRHICSELQNDNSNLQIQFDKAQKSLLVTQTEMEQYRARAQRILQEKEKLILKQADTDLEASPNDREMISCNEELRKELKFQEVKCNGLSEKLAKATNDLSQLQRNYLSLQKEEQETQKKLHDRYNIEMSLREVVEMECLVKAKELHSVLEELTQTRKEIATKSNEIFYLKEQLTKRHSTITNEDLESRLQSLTKTLIHKQDALETITTERNALLLQLEKYEKQHYKLVTELEKNPVALFKTKNSDESKIQIPQFLKISPFDAGVTRNVKQAYSTLDAFSIRTGVFLRRYPLARVFVFFYMVLVHLWVLFILWSYVPSSSH